jgi:hypothetical protein
MLSDLIVNQYMLIDATPDFAIPVTLDRCVQGDGSTKWAIRDGGCCFDKRGRWIYEPQSSTRDEVFFRAARWDSAEEALAFWEAAGCPTAYRHAPPRDPQPDVSNTISPNGIADK